MSHRKLARALLAGDVPVIRYEAVIPILEAADYTLFSTGGPERTWRHPICPENKLTVRDGVGKAMYSRYVRKTGSHLRMVLEMGGFDANVFA